MIMKELFAIVNTSLSGTGAWDLLKSHLVHILTLPPMFKITAVEKKARRISQLPSGSPK